MKWLILVLFAAAAAQQFYSNQSACHTDDDCGRNECCVSPPASTNKLCKTLAEEGQACRPSDPNADELANMYLCQCENGLECVPSDKGGNDEDGEKFDYECVKPTHR